MSTHRYTATLRDSDIVVVEAPASVDMGDVALLVAKKMGTDVLNLEPADLVEVG